MSIWASLVAPAVASPLEFYGSGARRMGRAGAGLALADGTNSILTDPAALPGLEHPELSLGFLVANGSFAEIPDVWWDTNQDGWITEADPPLEVSSAPDPIHGILLAGTRPFGPHIAAGLALFLPVERLLRLQTFDPQVPTYFLYSNRTQRYEMGAGVAARPWGGIAIGAGVQMIPRARFTLTGTLDATVAAPDTTGTTAGSASEIIDLSLDIHGMSLDLVPGFSPNLSLHWNAGDAVPALEGLQLAAAWRGEAGLPIDVEIALQINAGTGEIGDLEPIILPLAMAIQLGLFDHYVPAQVNFGAAYTLVDTLTLALDLRRTAWDRMQVSVVEVQASEVSGALVDLGDNPVGDGNPYDITLRATWAPRAGAELKLPAIDGGERFGEVRLLARGGVGFEPTPLVSQSTESALLDADRVMFAVGAGVACDDPFRKKADRRMQLDGFFQYHVVATGLLDRGTPEAPTAGYSVSGAPVPIGGHMLAAGVEWSFAY